ncbi:MAG: hypothetical protein ACK5KM_14545, partial [Hyphomicrobiaceae bacterium]
LVDFQVSTTHQASKSGLPGGSPAETKYAARSSLEYALHVRRSAHLPLSPRLTILQSHRYWVRTLI